MLLKELVSLIGKDNVQEILTKLHGKQTFKFCQNPTGKVHYIQYSRLFVFFFETTSIEQVRFLFKKILKAVMIESDTTGLYICMLVSSFDAKPFIEQLNNL